MKLTESQLRQLIKKTLKEVSDESLNSAEMSQKNLVNATKEDQSVMGQNVDVAEELASLTDQVNAMVEYYRQYPTQYDNLVKSDMYSLRQSIANLERALQSGSTQMTRGEMVKPESGGSIFDKADRYKRYTEI